MDVESEFVDIVEESGQDSGSIVSVAVCAGSGFGRDVQWETVYSRSQKDSTH